MTIRIRLTLLFTLITATILLIFAAVVYISAKENREREFYTLLEKEAITKANLFFDARVEMHTLQEIYKSNREILNEVEVAIFSSEFELLYHDAVDIDFVKETPEMLKSIALNGSLQFYQNDWQVVGMRYNFQGKTFLITAAALDEYGFNKLSGLLQNMLFIFVISMVFIYLAGRYFSKKAFVPIREMTEKAQNISATNLGFRLNHSNKNDELSALAQTFNDMLSRLEHSFDSQKAFVSNISHELRTPLSVMIAELEVANAQDENTVSYQKVIKNVLNDARKIERLANDILDLAKASYDKSEIAFQEARIDEVLLDAKHALELSNPNYSVNIDFDNDFDNENELVIQGNEYLLKVAFMNLMENACKFSEQRHSVVRILNNEDSITLKFIDSGIGISEKDLKHIFTPFFRGQNQTFAEGHGIGLSLTQRIITLHKGNISVVSKQLEGTTFSLDFPRGK